MRKSSVVVVTVDAVFEVIVRTLDILSLWLHFLGEDVVLALLVTTACWRQ